MICHGFMIDKRTYCSFYLYAWVVLLTKRSNVSVQTHLLVSLSLVKYSVIVNVSRLIFYSKWAWYGYIIICLLLSSPCCSDVWLGLAIVEMAWAWLGRATTSSRTVKVASPLLVHTTTTTHRMLRLFASFYYERRHLITRFRIFYAYTKENSLTNNKL